MGRGDVGVLRKEVATKLLVDPESRRTSMLMLLS